MQMQILITFGRRVSVLDRICAGTLGVAAYQTCTAGTGNLASAYQDRCSMAYLDIAMLEYSSCVCTLDDRPNVTW